MTEPLPPDSAARLSDMTFTWGPSSQGMLTIDALNRGLILPCATALLKMRPYMINSSLAHGLQRLHLESVAFETGDMAALCELFPNVRVASFDCCILSRCSAVPEAVRGWEGLQECLFLGDEEQNFGLGKASLEEDLRVIRAVVQARQNTKAHGHKPLILSFWVYKIDGWGDDFSHPGQQGHHGDDWENGSEHSDVCSAGPLSQLRAVWGWAKPLLDGCVTVALRTGVLRE